MRRAPIWYLIITGILFAAGIMKADVAPVSVSGKLGAAAQFALLALNNGNMTINSATSIIGNVGYSSGVTSTTNQKVGTFTGTAYVHSGASFNDTPATFAPSGGIITGGAADTLLNQANADAATAAAYFGTLASSVGPTTALGAVSSDQILTATGNINVYTLDSLSFNSNTLTLNGDSNDLFLFRVTGSNFAWAQSQTILNGVSAGQVIFYFVNATTAPAITVNKSGTDFSGTIFAPTSSVIYHNPATFTGSIIAEDIDVHSDFNITSETPVPEPAYLSLLCIGFAAIAVARRKRTSENFDGR